MFEKCCNMHSNNKYMILHNPKPISLSESMDETIKNLLWYAPNIDSYQAAKNDLIQDKIYDNFAFTWNKTGNAALPAKICRPSGRHFFCRNVKPLL